jgi:nucleoside-diphosphate kinase
MVFSSGSARLAPSGETFAARAPRQSRALDLFKPMLGKLNEPGTFVSGKVHLGEIAATRAAMAGPGKPAFPSDRLPFADGVDISAATSISALQGNIMAIERTFSIIKPDATARNLTGAINALIEKAGLRIVAQKRVHMTREQAETFYAIHKARPFFGELVDFMISGPVVVQVLEGENAVLRHRDVMGATDPSKAAEGTIRKLHAKSIGENSVHGSDAPETAAIEIVQFFSGNEIVG